MQLFGYTIKKTPVENKKAYASSLASLYNGGFVVSNSTYYNLYKDNPDIRGCINKIAWAVARNGLYLLDNNKQNIDDEQITTDVARLFSFPTFPKFKKELFKNYLLSGELYIKPKYNLKWEVAGFDIIDSRAVTKNLDSLGKIISYKVTLRGGATVELDPEQLAFYKLEDDIRDTVNGMGLLNGVVYDGLSDLEAQKTNYALYQNSAIPSAILLLDGELTADEQQIAKEMFNAQFRGSDNAHKTLIAGGVKDIKTLSITPRDMEFINQRHLTTEKVCSTFGVPKSILGYVDSVNYSNGKELRKEFIEGTIRPYEADIENILNDLMQRFVPDIRANYYIKCDGEQIEAQMERYEAQRKDVESGILTINEVRIDRGLEPSVNENCDKHIISRNVVLLEDIALDAVLTNNE